MTETKTKILDTAEKLFGEYGYAATSLRRVIAEAGVNLAAVHYHFGSKQALLDQVILRKAGPVNERRLKLLDRFEAEAAPGAPALEKILEAFVVPAMLPDKSPEFLKLMGRVHAEGLMPEIARRNFQPMIERFLSALRRLVPGMAQSEFVWKAHFAIGAMAHAFTAKPYILPGAGQEPALNVARMLVAFISGGLREPVVLEKEVEVNQ